MVGSLVATDICKLLLDIGVNGNQEDEIGNISRDPLMDRILVASAVQGFDTCGFESDQIWYFAVLSKLCRLSSKRSAILVHLPE